MTGKSFDRESTFNIDIHGYLDDEEANEVIKAANKTNDPIRNKTMLIFLYHTGCRVSEMLGVRKKDVMFKKKMIVIETLKKRNKILKPIYRFIPMTEVNKDQLHYYMDYLQKKEKIELDDNDKIFPISRQSVYYMVRTCGDLSGHEMVGDTWMHPHAFRHSFAINYLKRGGDLRKLQMILGHSSINITSVYLKFAPDDLVKEFEKVYGGN